MRVALTAVAIVAAARLALGGEAPLRSHTQALQTARERLRPILIDFHEGECGYESLPGEKDSLGRAVHTAPMNDCGRMVEEVWSRGDVKAEASASCGSRPRRACTTCAGATT